MAECKCCGYNGDMPFHTCNRSKCDTVCALQAENTTLRTALEKIKRGDVRRMPFDNKPILGTQLIDTPELGYLAGFEMALLECGEVAGGATKALEKTETQAKAT